MDFYPVISNITENSFYPDAFVLNIRDEDENEFVLNHLKPLGDLVKWVWLGMYYDLNESFFTIRHEQTNKCIKSANADIILTSCSENNDTLKWKWVSSHRLFNLGSQMCLGIGHTFRYNAKMFQCNSHSLLYWTCNEGYISNREKYKLAQKDGYVVGIDSSNDKWRRGDTSETICELPYQAVFTTGGNSYGNPCEFPFLTKGKWHHDCITDTTRTQEWCATSTMYDSERKWGYCLKPVDGCDQSWERNSDLQSCYQFNVQSFLTWREAYDSCQSQNADLLSISSAAELQYITAKMDLPDSVWIGLNHLDISGGWQWSDNTPLSFINWNKEMTGFPILDDSNCGVLNMETGGWNNIHCYKSLPYICKKKLDSSKSELQDYWTYLETQCEQNWIPYNGFCSMLQPPSVWEEAAQSCKKQGADLISIHSLADIEMVVTTFQNENEEMWSGLKNGETPVLFKWSDGTETLFTYWDKNEPNIPFNTIPNCVSFSGQTGYWHVRDCKQRLKYVCKKKGTIKKSSTSDTGCPQDQDWRRHGNFCYFLDKEEVTFGGKCNLTVTTKFEQEFLNGLMREHGKMKKYFWTSLRGSSNTRDYWWETSDGKMDMSYSNWNTFQPAYSGGCVAMTTGKSLGKWEVKNCESFKAHSICKKSIGPQKPEVIPKPSGPCPDDWNQGSDFYCYKPFLHERILRKRTWAEAEAICEEFGGHLPSFTHEEELTRFLSMIRTTIRDARWIWIGLNKRNVALHGSWQWSDGRPFSSVLTNTLNEDEYDQRDCVTLKVNLPHPWDPSLFDINPVHCDMEFEWVCQIPRGAVAKTPEWYIPDLKSVHGPPLIIDQIQFWFVSNPHLSYKEAALYCANNGTELASIESTSERNAIQTRLRNDAELTKNFDLAQSWWTQSMKKSPHTSWFTDIIVREGSFASECWYISAQSWIKAYFEYTDCNQTLPFICKQNNVSLLEKESKIENQFKEECPKNWFSFGNKCFIQTKPKLLSYDEARKECEGVGASLPTVSSQLEQDFITTLLPKRPSKIWIGLKMRGNSNKQNWDDGPELSYRNFNPLLHSVDFSSDLALRLQYSYIQCVYMINDPNSTFIGMWGIDDCSTSHYMSLCQKNKVNRGNQTQQVVPEDLKYEGHKYKIIKKSLTWYNALTECNKHNMTLVSIPDQYHLAFLAVEVGRLDHPMWIGLSNKDNGIHYRWQDGRPVTFNRWSKDDADVNEACVFMDSDSFWRTMSCDSELPGAFCHFSSDNPVEKPFENTQSCPLRIKDTPWIPFRNNCYIFLISRDRWPSNESKSRYVCSNHHPDAFVLNIRDEDENEFVLNHLKPLGDLVKWVWLGIYYDLNVKKLRYYDETFVKYSNWRFGRPAANNESFYAAMNLDGYWEFLSSTNPVSFKSHAIVACKIEIDSSKHYSKPFPSAILYEDITYHIIQKNISWNEAESECKQEGSNLASVHNKVQQQFLESIVRQDGFPLWIGLKNSEVNRSRFDWSDGSGYDYVHLEFEQSNYFPICVLLDTKGAWRSKGCSEVLDGAICYRPSPKSAESRAGVTIGLAVFIPILFLVTGLLIYLYKTKGSYIRSKIRYQRTVDGNEAMIVE